MRVQTAGRLRVASYLMLVAGVIGIFLYNAMSPGSGYCNNSGCVGAGAAAILTLAALFAGLSFLCSLVNAIAFHGYPGRTSFPRKLELAMFVFPWVALVFFLVFPV